MKVNQQEADPGCYIDGVRGQYAIDYIAEVAEQFGLSIPWDKDPRYWRTLLDADDADSKEVSDATDSYVDSGDYVENLLNDATEGGYWSWEDGEFFLVQTEIEGTVWVQARTEEGEDYDDAWQSLLDHGTAGCVTSYDDLNKGDHYFAFKITVHYEQEDS